MKKHRPIKHAHRKAMIAEKKARGKYSRSHLPHKMVWCPFCWAFYKDSYWKKYKPPYDDGKLHCIFADSRW